MVNVKIFSKFDEFYQQKDSRSSMTPKQDKHKKITQRNIRIKLLTTSVEDNMFEAISGKMTYARRTKDKMSIDRYPVRTKKATDKTMQREENHKQRIDIP